MRSRSNRTFCAACGDAGAYARFNVGHLCPTCAAAPERIASKPMSILREWTIKDAFAMLAARTFKVTTVEKDGEVVATIQTLLRKNGMLATTIFTYGHPSVHGWQRYAESKRPALRNHTMASNIAVAIAGGVASHSEGMAFTQ